MNAAAPGIESRLKHLEEHLADENPVLLDTVKSFRDLDQVAYRLGLLTPEESFANLIPWWPLISILGTFSAGKSTFINHYLGYELQRTGNQAVDERFTVICYSEQKNPHALPGVALDADPRFPFYQISKDIEAVAAGEGERVDAYLQLKTCPSERLKGKILIDSPGFDADAQRTAVLRITDHIIHLSDLVLVLFDARHPEPGAMQDTLEHLVAQALHRPDTSKFLYVLNQIDTTAREDNPEDVVAAWQRALGEKGLTAGRFYTIYNPEAAVPIDDPAKRERFEAKRDADLSEIHSRMGQVEVERAYRIVASLEKNARDIEERAVPLLERFIAAWRRRVLWGDAVLFGLLALGGGALLASDPELAHGFWGLLDSPVLAGILGLVVLVVLIAIHFGMRALMARTLEGALEREARAEHLEGDLKRAFRHNTRAWRSIFRKHPAGWGRNARQRVEQVIQATDTYVQALNDRFTNPSGERHETVSGKA